MKLLTLNCHSWQEENQFEKIEILAKTIQENSYDVIALQEVSQPIERQILNKNIKSDNFVIVLLDALKKLGVTDYQFVWDFSHISYNIYEEGLALLTKHPIEEKHSFFISKSEDTNNWKTRKTVGLKIRYQDLLLSFYSCHLGWWQDEEEPFSYQADALLQHVPREGVFFLMGDFNNNANVEAEGYDYLMKKGLYDTYGLTNEKDSGVTVKGKIDGWGNNTEDLRIDLILTNQPARVNYSKVIFNDRNKPIISDHFGVEIELDVSKLD